LKAGDSNALDYLGLKLCVSILNLGKRSTNSKPYELGRKKDVFPNLYQKQWMEIRPPSSIHSSLYKETESICENEKTANIYENMSISKKILLGKVGTTYSNRSWYEHIQRQTQSK
jgi:hypothetical protein